MPRHPNTDWNLPEQCQTWEQVNTAVLMDIRDELRKMNRVLTCPRFTAIPAKLDEIRRNTARRRRKNKK